MGEKKCGYNPKINGLKKMGDWGQISKVSTFQRPHLAPFGACRAKTGTEIMRHGRSRAKEGAS